MPRARAYRLADQDVAFLNDDLTRGAVDAEDFAESDVERTPEEAAS